MNCQVEEMLAAARRDRQAGNVEEAERRYRCAAKLAREEGNSTAVAHALPHVSDLARERASIDEPLAAASQAVAIYRAQDDPHPLDLANALRLQALALREAGEDRHVLPLWNEAREFYRSLGVYAGVEEVSRKLNRSAQHD